MAKTNMEREEKFRKGDLVRLLSGGPSMTVIGVNTDNKVECIWFLQDGDNNWDGPFTAAFIPEVLEGDD